MCGIMGAELWVPLEEICRIRGSILENCCKITRKELLEERNMHITGVLEQRAYKSCFMVLLFWKIFFALWNCEHDFHHVCGVMYLIF